jgi:predicted secreted protein
MIARIAASLAATAAAVILLSGLAIVASVRLFGLTLAGALSLYFVIWWTALFAVLPFGIRSQHEDGPVTPGTDPGAPALPRLREKAVWTTLLAGAVLVATALLLPLTGL